MQLRTGLQDSFTVERKLSAVLWAVAYPMYGSGADHSADHIKSLQRNSKVPSEKQPNNVVTGTAARGLVVHPGMDDFR